MSIKCPKCNTDSPVHFFQENLICDHCGDEVDIDYYMCPKCGSTFKMSGGEVYSCVQFSKDEFKNLFGATTEEVLKQYTTDMMSDNIHSCIKCGGLAFEVSEGLYKCNSCGFEIEIEET